MLLLKLIIVILLLFVVGSLFSALYFLMTDSSKSKRVVRSLSWRIALSLFLVLLLFIGIQTGLIVPHDVGG
ncbi:MAG: twin transmembrane helix small protein [Gammaproteobacteria bacterium]|nr:twin transmembrane helix small protein [Gammaproteobacteria bacterium]CAJ2376828.1 MAG: Twin transmembrane helix small protein [Arenicellales bacterium IbO2]MDA7961298.1 twin transmembrane helix small protein [Gammaproteobacteria bacterium]MDA7968218.1 twin transmembrane helix small protein [Gammaproteobacteria bacterium]MDA7969340.1 twin transmembrane helix small protein [Gammaproteobacteria bacterium]